MKWLRAQIFLSSGRSIVSNEGLHSQFPLAGSQCAGIAKEEGWCNSPIERVTLRLTANN